MNKKNDVEVIINKKRYVLCGYESGEYLQKVASYLNGKHQEMQKEDSFQSLDLEMKTVLLDINIVDDYFKALKQIEQLEKEKATQAQELFDVRHEVIASQSKLQDTEDELELLKMENQEAQKKIVELETQLKNKKENN